MSTSVPVFPLASMSEIVALTIPKIVSVPCVSSGNSLTITSIALNTRVFGTDPKYRSTNLFTAGSMTSLRNYEQNHEVVINKLINLPNGTAIVISYVAGYKFENRFNFDQVFSIKIHDFFQ